LQQQSTALQNSLVFWHTLFTYCFKTQSHTPVHPYFPSNLRIQSIVGYKHRSIPNTSQYTSASI